MIAFPSDSYQEGMKTTTNPDEATPEDDGTDDTVDDNSNEDISYDENGNPVDEGVIGGADDEAGMAGDGADGDTADSVISGAGEDAGDGVDEMPADEAGADTAEGGAGRWYLICGTSVNPICREKNLSPFCTTFSYRWKKGNIWQSWDRPVRENPR